MILTWEALTETAIASTQERGHEMSVPKKARRRSETVPPTRRDPLEWAYSIIEGFRAGTERYPGLSLWMGHANAGYQTKLDEMPGSKSRHFNPNLPGITTGFYGSFSVPDLQNLAHRRRWFEGNPLGIVEFLSIAAEAGKWLGSLSDLEREPFAAIDIAPQSWQSSDDESRWIWTLFDLAWFRLPGDKPINHHLLAGYRRTWSSEFRVEHVYDSLSDYWWRNADRYFAEECKLLESELTRGVLTKEKADRRRDQGRRSADFCRSPDVQRWLSRPGPPDWYYSFLTDVMAGSTVAMSALVTAIWGPEQLEEPAGLSRGKEAILKFLLARGATTPDRRVTTEVIDENVGSEQGDGSSTKESVSSLRKSGHVDTRRGRQGGVWLLALGIRTAERLVERPAK